MKQIGYNLKKRASACYNRWLRSCWFLDFKDWCRWQITATKGFRVRVLLCESHARHYINTLHYCDVIMGAMAYQITSLAIVYSTVHPGADQRKHQSSASLACVWGIHLWPVNSPHKGPVTRKMFPFDDVIMDSHIIIHFNSLEPSEVYMRQKNFWFR